ncbi:hypothetical protein A2U01_0088373, partial [Trifolium medium]|nr:hypothetical protein [Trifolium medium]
FLFADNMADFADELLKIAAEHKGPKRGKKVKSRASVVLEQSGSGGSSSPGGRKLVSSRGAIRFASCEAASSQEAEGGSCHRHG